MAVWELDENYSGSSDIGEKPAVGGRKAFIGIVGFDTEEITMAEVEDTGIYRGRLLDDDRLQLTYIESDLGDAVLLRAVLPVSTDVKPRTAGHRSFATPMMPARRSFRIDSPGSGR